MNEIIIKTPYIKLDQLLKLADVCETGGVAKEAILSGKVFVNHEREIRRGRKIKDGDIISIEGFELIVRKDGVLYEDKKFKT